MTVRDIPKARPTHQTSNQMLVPALEECEFCEEVNLLCGF
jgi:hypothetical protein